jgi:cytochrome subunit of sulfide dehydrogenase
MNPRSSAKPHAVFVVLCAFAIPATSQAAGDAATLEVRSLAANCAACHGTEGRAVEGAGMVALAGYPKAALIAQMQAFRDGGRSATVMHQIARGYTDQQIETLATYFAAQPASRR